MGIPYYENKGGKMGKNNNNKRNNRNNKDIGNIYRTPLLIINPPIII
jgi:hypothetical protein